MIMIMVCSYVKLLLVIGCASMSVAVARRGQFECIAWEQIPIGLVLSVYFIIMYYLDLLWVFLIIQAFKMYRFS